MKSEYPYNWKEITTKIKTRDLNRCVICWSNKRLEVHHTREKAIPNNLITLCYTCHNCFANSYAGFKKKIRLFNDIRLNGKKSFKEKEDFRNRLIEEINNYEKRINTLKIKIKKNEHKTLENF